MDTDEKEESAKDSKRCRGPSRILLAIRAIRLFAGRSLSNLLHLRYLRIVPFIPLPFASIRVHLRLNLPLPLFSLRGSDGSEADSGAVPAGRPGRAGNGGQPGAGEGDGAGPGRGGSGGGAGGPGSRDPAAGRGRDRGGAPPPRPLRAAGRRGPGGDSRR